MGKRETFSGYVECKPCKVGGQAHFEENENPAHNNWELDTVLESADEPFKIVNGAILCGHCGATVRKA